MELSFYSSGWFWLWAYVDGLIITLVLYCGLVIRLTKFRGKSISIGYVAAVLGISLLWFLVWGWVIWSNIIRRGDLSYIQNLINALFGDEASIRWFHTYTGPTS